MGFNSRTLGRVRHGSASAYPKHPHVSIHAPWEGCDAVHAGLSRALKGFNSRTLGRVRRPLASRSLHSWCFNSRTLGRVRHFHPLYSCCFCYRFNSRTLGRVRRVANSGERNHTTFQFTHPGKGATAWRTAFSAFSEFQFTHPGKGATHPSGQ